MPTEAEFQRKKYKKDLLQPYHRKNGRTQINEEYIKVYGTDAIRANDPEAADYYDKKLKTDKHFIHKHLK